MRPYWKNKLWAKFVNHFDVFDNLWSRKIAVLLTIFKFREDKSNNVFREDKSNNVFREIRKCFRKTAKFEFFAKQIIYLESPDHPLQNDI